MNLPLGALYAWSIFVLPLEQEFGWTRRRRPAVFTIAVFVFGLSFIAAGRLQDKKVPFWISVAGSVLFSLGWVLATYANDLVTLYLTMGVVLGIGSGFGYAAPILALGSLLIAKRPEAPAVVAMGEVKGARAA